MMTLKIIRTVVEFIFHKNVTIFYEHRCNICESKIITKKDIMKKIIAGSVLGCALFTSGVFADYEQPVVISAPLEMTTQNWVKDTTNQYDIIIRNNVIESDYEYNNSHYFTTKITTENIVIPEEIKDDSEKIYFLVEQWRDRTYYYKSSLEMSDEAIETVKDEYNYKVVDFKAWQKEYVFDNSDLIKNFWDDKATSIHITLMAELSDGSKKELSNTVYVNVNDKKGTLQNLYNQSIDQQDLFFGYYNSNDLEIYLEEISNKMTRTEYKKLLSKADTRIYTANKKNEDTLTTMLNSIKKESDFEKNISKYTNYSETRTLLSNLGSAVKNQLQNIRAFDAIDAILK